MQVTLNEILALAGRLDDAPGFDTPRERFRRLLVDRVTEPAYARSLIEQGQRSLGEQYHRALQDTLVIVGRFLGFETTFGSYLRTPGVTAFAGHWRSRRRLNIVLEVRTDQTPRKDLTELSQAVSALALAHVTDLRHLGLSIVTPLYGGRARLEDAMTRENPHPEIRLTSASSLLWLAEMVSSGRLNHEQIVRLLTSGASLDFVVDLMERFATSNAGEQAPEAAPEVVGAAPAERSAPSYWMATIDGDATTTPAQLVDFVIGKRQMLGIGQSGADPQRVRPWDWICFSVTDKGIVGHAQVESIVDGTGLIRDAHRFSQVCRLKHVEIYDAPIGLGAPLERQHQGDPSASVDNRSSLETVSREAFRHLTVLSSGASLDFVVDLMEAFAPDRGAHGPAA